MLELTAFRENGKRKTYRISKEDKEEANKLKDKLGIKSFNSFISFLLQKYEDDREFIPEFAVFIRYCIKREIKENASL